jgi:hypothetical protein
MTSCCADRPTLQSLLPWTHFLIHPLHASQPHSLTIAFHVLDAMALTCADRPSTNTPVAPSLDTFPHSSTPCIPTSFSHHRLPCLGCHGIDLCRSTINQHSSRSFPPLVHISSFNHSNLILSPSPSARCPLPPARVACRVQRANDAESCKKWEASLRSDGTWADVDYADKTRLGVPVPCTATMPLRLRSRSHHHPLPFCADSTFSSSVCGCIAAAPPRTSLQATARAVAFAPPPTAVLHLIQLAHRCHLRRHHRHARGNIDALLPHLPRRLRLHRCCTTDISSCHCACVCTTTTAVFCYFPIFLSVCGCTAAAPPTSLHATALAFAPPPLPCSATSPSSSVSAAAPLLHHRHLFVPLRLRLHHHHCRVLLLPHLPQCLRLHRCCTTDISPCTIAIPILLQF